MTTAIEYQRNGSTITAVKDLADDFLAVLPRVFARDYTVFGTDPTEIADRLNWLIAPAVTDCALLDSFAADIDQLGVDDVLLCGMGGSSLYARTLAPHAPHAGRSLSVIDTTHPDALRRIDAQTNYARALLLVGSKSGSTSETAALQAFFTGRLTDVHGAAGLQRVGVITDPDSPLAKAAHADGLGYVLSADPHVGGRFSAHTLFGLAPAGLIGIDVRAHLLAAEHTFTRLRNQVPDNVAVRLGAHMAAWANGHDRVANLLLELADPTDPLALWIEQLIAESLGKNGRGLNVLRHATAAQASLTLRLVADTEVTEATLHEATNTLTLRVPHGHRGVAVTSAVLMLAVALAGRAMNVNPFDQPNVAEAKKSTAAALQARTMLEPPTDLAAALANAATTTTLVVLAYVDPDGAHADAVTKLAVALAKHRQMPVTVGFGPRYLHSTGQLHKGALVDGCYLVIGPEPMTELAIPTFDYGFDTLISAQVAGDVATLRARGRNVTVVTLDALARYVAALSHV